jgi:hypothetical protein
VGVWHRFSVDKDTHAIHSCRFREIILAIVTFFYILYSTPSLIVDSGTHTHARTADNRNDAHKHLLPVLLVVDRQIEQARTEIHALRSCRRQFMEAPTSKLSLSTTIRAPCACRQRRPTPTSYVDNFPCYTFLSNNKKLAHEHTHLHRHLVDSTANQRTDKTKINSSDQNRSEYMPQSTPCFYH